MSQQQQQLIRERMCQKVAGLPLDCSVDLVRTALEPLLQEAAETVPQQDEGSASCQEDSIISPLMVASDKGNVACLEYFAQQQSTRLFAMIGKPLDRASESMGGNSAVHHAATSGCVPALTLWHAMDRKEYSYSKLGSIPNAHGDTPLQIAATAGHLAFLQRWYDMALKETTDDNKNDTKTAIQRILELQNDSGDTCVSLACCHGQLDVLQFLLRDIDIHPTISHEEVTKYQQACQRIIESVARCTVSDPEALKTIQNRKDKMCQGLELLRQAYAQQVEQAAQELMSSEQSAAGMQMQQQQQSNNRKQSKKNKNKKAKAKATRVSTVSSNKDDNIPSEDNTNDKLSPPSSSEKDTVRVTTLADGKLAVSVPGQQAPDPTALPLVLANNHNHISKPSVRDMFRQRLQGATTAPNSTDDNSEIDAMMDALCLDVSMLLYTPHGMALNLSPSQLEAVQHILHTQLSAVQEARDIQNRKHCQQQQQQSSNPSHSES